jgi:hypothetical protein
MKPVIDSLHSGGLQDEGAAPGSASVVYFIVDEESRCPLGEREFDTRQDAEQYLESHREEFLANGLPLLDEASEVLASRLVEKLENERREGSGQKTPEAIAFMRRNGWRTRVRDASLALRIAALEDASAGADGKEAP